jgi:hypothetical protein
MRVSAGGAKAESLTTKDKPASDGALTLPKIANSVRPAKVGTIMCSNYVLMVVPPLGPLVLMLAYGSIAEELFHRGWLPYESKAAGVLWLVYWISAIGLLILLFKFCAHFNPA